jgi:hypothetical protein
LVRVGFVCLYRWDLGFRILGGELGVVIYLTSFYSLCRFILMATLAVFSMPSTSLLVDGRALVLSVSDLPAVR